MEREYNGYHFEVNLPFTMHYSQYVKLTDLLEEYKPKKICELGCGQSTVIFKQYIEKYNAQLVSIDHNESFKLHDNTVIFPLVEDTNIAIGNETYGSCNKYNGFENWLDKQDKFDFVYVDGPVGFGHRLNYNYGRIQMISFASFDKLSDNVIMLIHDTERQNEKNSIELLSKKLIEHGYKFEIEHDDKEQQLSVVIITKNQGDN